MKLFLSTAVFLIAAGASAESPNVLDFISTPITENAPPSNVTETASGAIVFGQAVITSEALADTATREPAAAKAAKDDLKLNFPVVKYQLKNGLTVLLHEDRTVPLISYHTWYKVGSRDEAPGITGSAHMLEHLMFKGSKNYPGKSFDRLLHENGIVNNAFTSYDYTGFYENLPSSKLEMIMAIEVDRMSNLELKQEDLLSERDVVKEERRWRVDDSPMGVLMESVMGTAFKNSNYRWPIIGTMKDISEFKMETMKEFHSKYYVPNNAILVIAGDFKISEAKKLIEKYYGPLVAKPLPSRVYPKEPAQTVQRNATVRRDVQAKSVTVAFHGTPNAHDDMYALDLASSILGNGSSSRLYKRMVYQRQAATSAYAYHSGMQDHGIFGVGLNLKPGLEIQENLEIVYQEIWKLRNKLVSEQELASAKTQVMKGLVDGLTTVDGKARALAVNEILTGSYENLFKDLEKYNAVTAEKIKEVANKYLNQTQRSVVVLEPRKKVTPAVAPLAAPAGAPVEGAAAPSAAPSAAPASVSAATVIAPTAGSAAEKKE